MAASQTIQEAVEKGCKGLIADQDTLILELRDLFAHRTMILGENATAMDLFNDVFKNIPAMKGLNRE